MHLHEGDLTDYSSLSRIISSTLPDEVYNLGAQSHVAVSFDAPIATADVNALGTLRLLEIIRSLSHSKRIRFYQASTSELFGKVQTVPQDERTPFYPRSPYGVAKLFAYWSVVNYRESYDLFACNGILFNHESPRRGLNFVTKKITRDLAKFSLGQIPFLSIGNLDAKRDWGHARDYVYMQWLMLQQDSPRDYVIASGKQTSVRSFIEQCCDYLELGPITWSGNGISETGVLDDGRLVCKVDPKFYRPCEVETLLGDPSLAISELGWLPKVSLKELISEMVDHDLQSIT